MAMYWVPITPDHYQGEMAAVCLVKCAKAVANARRA